jgi:hypothetical protein
MIFFLISFLISCGGAAKKEIHESSKHDLGIPAWFLNPPEDTNDYFYTTGTTTSKLLNVSIDRAKNAGTNAVASKIDTMLERVITEFVQSKGFEQDDEILDQFSSVQKDIAGQGLDDVELVEQKFTESDKGFITTYVLMRYPVGAAAQRILTSIAKRKRLNTEFETSRMYKQLAADFKRYEGLPGK